jgi:hypothetical protein
MICSAKIRQMFEICKFYVLCLALLCLALLCLALPCLDSERAEHKKTGAEAPVKVLLITLNFQPTSGSECANKFVDFSC